MLFTCKQHCLLKFFFRGTYLQRIYVFMQISGVTGLAVQLFNKIKKKEKKKTKNMIKQVSQYFRGVMSKYTYFWGEFIPFCMF